MEMEVNEPVSASAAATWSTHFDRRWNGQHRGTEHTTCPSTSCETASNCSTRRFHFQHTAQRHSSIMKCTDPMANTIRRIRLLKFYPYQFLIILQRIIHWFSLIDCQPNQLNKVKWRTVSALDVGCAACDFCRARGGSLLDHPC